MFEPKCRKKHTEKFNKINLIIKTIAKKQWSDMLDAYKGFTFRDKRLFFMIGVALRYLFF